MADRHPAVEQLLRWFAHDHLQGHAYTISARCSNLAHSMADNIGEGPELTVGLRKLLEAKDCFVRASIASNN